MTGCTCGRILRRGVEEGISTIHPEQAWISKLIVLQSLGVCGQESVPGLQLINRDLCGRRVEVRLRTARHEAAHDQQSGSDHVTVMAA